jgi:hypothetical protein
MKIKELTVGPGLSEAGVRQMLPGSRIALAQQVARP